MGYSKALRQKYVYFPNTGTAMFEDGVCYSTEELVVVAKVGGSPADLRSLHLVKQLFGGQILPPAKSEEDSDWEKGGEPITPSEQKEIPAVPIKKKPIPDSEPLTLDL